MILGADSPCAVFAVWRQAPPDQAANDASENVTNEPKVVSLRIVVSPFSIKTFDRNSVNVTPKNEAQSGLFAPSLLPSCSDAIARAQYAQVWKGR